MAKIVEKFQDGVWQQIAFKDLEINDIVRMKYPESLEIIKEPFEIGRVVGKPEIIPDEEKEEGCTSTYRVKLEEVMDLSNIKEEE